jgi:hypothetical protein
MKRRFHCVANPGATLPQTAEIAANEIRILLFFFLILWTLIVPRQAEATSVVALIDKANHRVVIATDCRVNRPHGSVAECKVIEEPGCLVAIAGLYREAGTAFNLRYLADAACQYPGDLREKAERFLQLSRRQYEAAVRHIQETDPSYFERMVASRPTEVVFAGLLKGRLTLLVRGLISDGRGTVTAERYESSDTASSPIGYFIGLNGHAREHINPSGQWERLGYIAAAREFVEMEIRANPGLVGAPISEVEIDERGMSRWISRGACDMREAD